MESDLRTLSPMNVLVKYADDTNVLVPSDSDIDQGRIMVPPGPEAWKRLRVLVHIFT